MTGNKEPKIIDNTSIDELLEDYGVIEPIEVEVPDYSYGAGQEPLNAEFQVRNLPNLASVAYSGSYDDLIDKPIIETSKSNTGYNDFASGTHSITGVGFMPKLIQVSVRTSNGLSWGTATSTTNQQSTALYISPTLTTDMSSSRLFRTGNIDGLGSLISIDSDGFTVSCDIGFVIIWTCFG